MGVSVNRGTLSERASGSGFKLCASLNRGFLFAGGEFSLCDYLDGLLSVCVIYKHIDCY